MAEDQEALFFGELLKQFRHRKKLTQQQIAQQIGASRETVSLWERGHFKPETITMVHELARALEVDEEEKRLLFETHLGTASILPLHNLPAPNPYFTGREDVLAQLHARLTPDSQRTLREPQALSGLGGIGKTQIAIAYAYRFRQHYHDILWVLAEAREAVIASYLMLARLLRLREREEREQHKIVEAVKRWLAEHKGWLLILDNLEDLGLVQEFLPSLRQGAVLLTTRRAETRPTAQPFPVDNLSHEEGSLFLLKRAGFLPIEASFESASSAQRTEARSIVEAVGGLSLALDQAGAYLAETRRSMADYLDLFLQQHSALLDRRGTLASDHPLSVLATFSLAFEHLRSTNQGAFEVLKICAFLAPDAIPLEILTKGAAQLSPILQSMARNTIQRDEALETLLASSLIHYDGEDHLITIHRLIQAIFQARCEEAERRLWRERVVLAIDIAFPHAEPGSWSQCERLLPHSLLAARFIEHDRMESIQAGSLLYKTASYFYERARYAEAEPFFRQALSVKERSLGPEDPQIIEALTGLANLYAEQRMYEKAEPLYRQAITIGERRGEPDVLPLARPLNSLAVLYWEQGRYHEAESLYQRALHILETALGADHPDVAHPLNNLANLYRDWARDEEAEELFQRTLQILEHHVGPDHPDVGNPLNNLAGLYWEQGRYHEAQRLWQRALYCWETGLGLDHPDLAYPLVGLANLYLMQGKDGEAERHFQRALCLREQYLGCEHPLVAYPLVGLANLYLIQGRDEEAEPRFQRALDIWNHQSGIQHPEVAQTLYDLALLQQKRGKRETAIFLAELSWNVRSHVLGATHPKTRATYMFYTQLL